MRFARKRSQNRIQCFSIANLAQALANTRRTRCDRSVDFDEHRSTFWNWVEGPNRYSAFQAMKNAHACQARLTDLRRADEIETALGRKAHCCLTKFANAQASPTESEEVAAIIQLSKMATNFAVSNETRGRKMLVIGRETIDHFPKRMRVGWGLGPARKVCALIGEGQRG